MKRVLSIVLCLALVATSNFAWARKGRDCYSDGERIISSSGDKPEWTDSLHESADGFEYFVGMSTQNEKLEEGKRIAIEEAKDSAIESIGELIQFKNQGIVTFEKSDMQNAWGSLKAPAFLKHKEITEWYYEKWESVSKCETRYHYNVWVRMAVPKIDYNTEKEKALAYLENAQQKELARKTPQLMPDSHLTQKDIKEFSNIENVNFVSKFVTDGSTTASSFFEPTSSRPPRKSHALLWSLITMVVLAGVGTGAYYGWKAQKGGGSPGVNTGGPVGGNAGDGGGTRGSGDISIWGPRP